MPEEKPAGEGTTPTGGTDGKDGKKPDAPAGAGAGGDKGKGAGGEGKGAGAGGEGSVAAGEGKTGEKKAPDTYALALPEGARLTKADLTQLETAGRAANLTNEELQAELDMRLNLIEAQVQTWADETKADKDLGGDKLEATQQLTKAAIDFLFPKGDPHREGFMDFLNRGGAGNNIHVVRALARIGKAQKEDGNLGGRGGGSGNAGKAPEDILYGPPSS